MVTELERQVREALVEEELKESLLRLQDPELQKLFGLDKEGIVQIIPQMRVSILQSYLSPQEIQEDIKPLEELKFSDPELYNIFHKQIEIAKISYEYVIRMTKIAQEQGIPESVKKETRYKIIREIFRDAEEYKLFHIRVNRLFNEMVRKGDEIIGRQVCSDEIWASTRRYYNKVLEIKTKEIFG